MIYELMDYLTTFFPCIRDKCPKLKHIADNIAKLERIADYEKSSRTIKCKLPQEAWLQYNGANAKSCCKKNPQ
jgi:hypothetical protein